MMDPFSWLLDVPLWLVIPISLIYALYTYLTWHFGYLEKQEVGVQKPKPLFGNMDPFMKKSMYESDMENYKQFGRVYGIYEGRKPALHIAEPDLIKQVTVKDFAVFPHARTLEMPKRDKVFAQFLTNLRGEEWKRVRNIMTPSFTTGKLKQMTYLIDENCQKLVVFMEKLAATQEPFNARRIMGAYTMDVIANCAFGTQIDTMENPDNDFVKNSQKIFSPAKVPWQFLVMIMFPKIVKYLPPVFPREVMDFFTNTINKVIDMRKSDKQVRRDFLSLLLEAKVDETGERAVDGGPERLEESKASKKIMTSDLIIAQSVLFLLAGHETTATLLGFALYSLAINPEVQDKLAAEVDEVFEQNEGQQKYETIAGMQYLDMVISETLRMYPPAVRIERQCLEDGHELNGITLMKDMIIGIPVYSIHHDPEFYPEPELFDPERFNAENKAKRDPFTYLPFGAGPRNCIAMRFALIEAKMALVTVIQNFRVNKCAQTEIPPKFAAGTNLLQPMSLTITIEKRKR